MKKIKNRAINLLSVGLIVPLVYLFTNLVSCTSTTSKGTTDQVEVFPVINPIIKDTVYVNEYVADIQSFRHVEIRARVGGFIEKIYVDEGQWVKSGQPLFSIGSKGYEADVLKAKASLKSAIADSKTASVQLENVKILVEQKIVSQSELDLAEATLAALEAKIEEARSEIANSEFKLSHTVIKAPFGGVINRIPHKTGSLVDEGTLLTAISDNEQVYAYFNMSEKEYLNLGPENLTEQKVSLVLANGALYSHEGLIETVDGEVEKNTGNIAFRAKFPNPKLLLKHGFSGKIKVQRKLVGAILVPQKSTFEIQDKTYIYVVDEANTIRMKSIVPKMRLPQFYVLESGLDATDRLLYEGTQLVREGDTIVPSTLESHQILTLLTGV